MLDTPGIARSLTDAKPMPDRAAAVRQAADLRFLG